MIVHVFKKDVRRLWKEIAITALLLGWLTWLDRWRSDSTPGSAEGWLNLLLPLAWAVLIALLVHEDVLVGDRQFWVTMPIRARSLLAAKALFIAAFIHAPDLAADATILWGRGFRPYLVLPQLFWKQFLLLVALTLPAVALATVVRNTAQFMIAAIALTAGVVFLNGGFAFDARPWDPWTVDLVRFGIAITPIAAASVAVMMLQYARRRVVLSRWIGIGAAGGAAALYALLPVTSTAAVRCALSPGTPSAGSLAIQFAPDAPPPVLYRSASASRGVLVPLRISGAPSDVTTRFRQLALEIESRDGRRYGWRRYGTVPRWAPTDSSVAAYLILETPNGPRLYNGRRGGTPNRLRLEISPRIYDAIKNGPVNIEGKLTAEFVRGEDPTKIPVGDAAAVPGLGICSSAIVNARFEEQLLRVVCESVDEISSFMRVRLIDPATQRDWIAFLGDSSTPLSHPRTTWLSPINRRATFFHLRDSVEARDQVPSAVIPNAIVEIAPEHATGCTVVRYELPDVVLSKFSADTAR